MQDTKNAPAKPPHAPPFAEGHPSELSTRVPPVPWSSESPCAHRADIANAGCFVIAASSQCSARQLALCTSTVNMYPVIALLAPVVAIFQELFKVLVLEGVWLLIVRVWRWRSSCLLRVARNGSFKVDGCDDHLSPAIIQRSHVIQDLLHNRGKGVVVIVPVSRCSFETWHRASKSSTRALGDLSAAEFVHVLRVRCRSSKQSWNCQCQAPSRGCGWFEALSCGFVRD